MEVNVKVLFDVSDKTMELAKQLAAIMTNKTMLETSSQKKSAPVAEPDKKPVHKKAEAPKEAKPEAVSPMEKFAADPAKAEPPKEAPKEAPKSDLRKTVRLFLANATKDNPNVTEPIRELMNTYGAERLTKIPEEKLQEFLTKAEALVDKVPAPEDK